MDKEEENKYVSQLQEVFTSCDSTGTGYLDKEELTDLCHKLHLNAQLPLLLQTLLGNDHFARVNFEEFKEGFVAVLSSTININISDDEDESSYLEPVIPDEVKPKFIKGAKKYGRRTRPELEAGENETKYTQEPNHGKNKKKSSLRRSSSLESVESLKSEEEAEIVKEPETDHFQVEGQLRTWSPGIYECPRRVSDMTENQVRDIWEELGVGHNGYLNLQELATVCKNIGLEDLSKEELEDLFNKLDRDGDGRVSFQEFQLGLFSHSPIASTPLKHRRPWALFQPDDSSHKTPSLLSGYGGFHLFSSIDDGTGFGNPEQITIIWEEEGLEHCKEILMSLDFSMEQQVNLMELTAALDNELIAAKNQIYLAALASYKHELLHQRDRIEQVCKERDKVRQDLERAERRTSLLVDEVDDHNSIMESLNESKIKDLEQEYRQRLSVMRSELESEREQFLQQTDQQKKKLETDLANYQMEQAYLKQKLDLSIKENSRLQKEMVEVVQKLSESESQMVKLQTNLDQILQEKRPGYPNNTEFYTQDEKFAEIIREYEVQCRELRDRNDELQIQLETLRSQLSESKYSRLLAKMKDNKLLHHKAKEKIQQGHDTPAKKGLASRLRRSVSAAGSNGKFYRPTISEASPVTMEAELTKHQVKELQQEIGDLKIQLETKVNYYEREIELMKTNFEKERKDTEQSFKLEMSELEEQKVDLEELNTKYQEVIDGLKEQLPKTTQLQEMEKRFEKERASMEEYYAKEISALGQRLSDERDQMEQELKRTHQHELQSMRDEAEEELSAKLAQYTEYWQSLIQKHLNDKNEFLQKPNVERKALIQDHMYEINGCHDKERELMAQWKHDEVIQQHAGLCKAFAPDKEVLEHCHRERIDRLNCETERLNTLLEKASKSDNNENNDQQLDEGPYHYCIKDISLLVSPEAAASTRQSHQVNMQMAYTDKTQLYMVNIPPSDAQCEQDSPLVFPEEGCPLNQAIRSMLTKLQKMENVVASLRAQLHEETKAQEALVKNQKGYDKQAHPNSQLRIGDHKKLLSNEKCTFQIDDGTEHVQNLESALELLRREKEELEEQLSVLAGHVGWEYKLVEKQPDLFRDEIPENKYSVSGEASGHDRDAPSWHKTMSKDDMLCLLQNQLVDAMNQCREMKQMTAKQIQETREQWEMEKNDVKDKLFQLEDLVQRLEQGIASNEDDRMELTRLSEDNAFLRSKAERLQQEIVTLDEANKKYRTKLEDLKKETENLHCKLEQLSMQNQVYEDELSQLNVRHSETTDQLNAKLQEVTAQKDNANTTLEQLQGMVTSLETEREQLQLTWQKERQQLQQDLQTTKQENTKYWDELCHLNTQSLQLMSTVSDLTAQREGSYEAIQDMNARLREVLEEKHQASALVEQLQSQLNGLKQESLQNQAGWQREKEQLESQVLVSRQEILKTQNEMCQLTCAVSRLQAENEGGQEAIERLENRLKVMTQLKEEATTTMERLQTQIHALQQEKADLCQTREQIKQDILTSQEKIQEMIVKHKQEKQDLLIGIDESNKQLLIMAGLQDEVSSLKQVKQSLEEQCNSLTRLLQEATEKASQIEELNLNLREAQTECQALRIKQCRLEEQLDVSKDQASQIEELKLNLREAQTECQALTMKQSQLEEQLEVSKDQLLEANSRLSLAQSQHVREVSQWKEKISSGVPKEHMSHLQSRLAEEHQKVQQLEERLRFHAEQTNRQLAMQKEEHERLLRRMEERMQEVEMKLKNVRVMLQEKVDLLREQLEKNTKSDILLKDLYVENAQLMKALQVTELRQKSAEKKNYLLEEKIAALNKVIKKIAPASLAV
ncbi:ninein-like protein [Gastrophryne carolinensis]